MQRSLARWLTVRMVTVLVSFTGGLGVVAAGVEETQTDEPTRASAAAAPTTTVASSDEAPTTTTTAAPTTTTTRPPVVTPPVPATVPEVTVPTVPLVPSSPCHPSYVGACVPANASDVDCLGGSGDGPEYTGPVRVVGPDEYDLDPDKDGLGCEP